MTIVRLVMKDSIEERILDMQVLNPSSLSLCCLAVPCPTLHRNVFPAALEREVVKDSIAERILDMQVFNPKPKTQTLKPDTRNPKHEI